MDNIKNSSREEKKSPVQTKSLKFGEKSAFGIGEFANRYGENGVNDIATPIYNIILGLNPAAIGAVLMLMRLWDAITDPVMGYISDNWKGKWGRRKPFLFIGAILMSVAYPLIWMASPSWTQQSKIIYFFSFSIVFFTAYTIYSVSFRALATEMTPDYEERTTIRIYAAFFNKVFMLFLPWIFPLAQMDIFPDPVVGIRAMATASAILILVSGIVCSIFPRERYRRVAVQQEKIKFSASFLSLSKDKNFLMLHGVGLGLLSSILLVATFGLYVNMFYVWGGDTLGGSKYFAISQNILQVLGFIMLFVISKYLIRFEKKMLIFGALLMALIGSLARWITYNQDIPELIFLDPFFFAPAYTIFWAVWLSMLADFCDYDEHLRGQRREGIFSAISGWIVKAGSALTFGLSGVLLTWTLFDETLGGDQPEGTLMKMRILLIGLPILCLVVAILLNAVYPLTKQRMHEIRDDLESRRGTI